MVALLSTGVLTFFLVLLNLFREDADLLLKSDVSVFVIVKLILLLIPFVLTFTLPWGILLAVLLVFGRISQDSELLSLKSSGIGLAPIIAPAIWLALVFSALSFWINASLGPDCRTMLAEVLRSNPLAFFNSNQLIDKFKGYRIFIGERHGNELEQVDIWKIDQQYRSLESIRADRATINYDLENQWILLKLYNARWEDRSLERPDDLSGIHFGGHAKEFPRQIFLAPANSTDQKNIVNETLSELGKNLFGPISQDHANMTPMLTEIQKRIAFSLSSFTFVLIGIPLALQTHRRETSIGVALSLAIVLVYYGLILLAEALKEHANFMPEIIIWAPNIIFQTLGFILLSQANRK